MLTAHGPVPTICRCLPAVACLALLPARSGGQSAAGDTGSIAGHVKLTTRVPGAPLASNAYPTRAVGHRAPHAAPEILNVVVYLKGVAFRDAMPTTRVELKQQGRGCPARTSSPSRATPRSTFRTPIRFFHNVFSLSGAATFDLGRYPQGQTRSREFPKAGLVKVYCHIHSHMSATILVLDHPYFVTPDNDGSFERKNACGFRSSAGTSASASARFR